MIIRQENGLGILFGDDLHDVFQHISNTQQTWGRSSTSSGPSSSWDLNAGWQGALKMIESGWTEGAVDFTNGLAVLPPNEAEPEYEYDVAGYLPDVALYCAGDPMHMRNDGHPEGRKPVIHMVLNNWILAAISAKEQRNYGLAIAAMIQQIEATGRQCEVDLVFVGRGYSPGTPVVGWKVKRAGDILDFAALAFSVAHPAAFRRIGFALLERLGGKWSTSGYGYNGPLTVKEAAAIGAEGAFLLNGVGHSVGACKTVEGALRFAANEINKAAGETLVVIQ